MKSAGMLFFLSGVVVLSGILFAEIFYPEPYSISQNMISNLGATPPPDSVSFEPSAGIFDFSMAIGGILILLGGFFTWKKLEKFLFIAILLMGLGTLGVGIFPAYHVFDHPISALTAFLFGGVAAVVSWTFIKSPLKFIALFLGLFSLTFLFLGILFPETVVPILGRGGVERLVAYPEIIWLLLFGIHIIRSK